jgi:hypothetical protein
MVTAVVVIGQPQEGNAHPDAQAYQQSNQGDHQASIEVFE